MFYEKGTKESSSVGSRRREVNVDHLLARREELKYLEGTKEAHESLSIFFTWQERSYTSIYIPEYSARKSQMVPVKHPHKCQSSKYYTQYP